MMSAGGFCTLFLLCMFVGLGAPMQIEEDYVIGDINGLGGCHRAYQYQVNRDNMSFDFVMTCSDITLNWRKGSSVADPYFRCTCFACGGVVKPGGGNRRRCVLPEDPDLPVDSPTGFSERGELVHSIIVMRHGERFPKLKKKKIDKNFPALREAMEYKKQVADGLRMETPSPDVRALVFTLNQLRATSDEAAKCLDIKSNELTSKGKVQSKLWGALLRQRYGPNAEITHIETTCTKRTKETATTFLEGFYGVGRDHDDVVAVVKGIMVGPDDDYDGLLKDGDYDEIRGEASASASKANMASLKGGMSSAELKDISASHIIDMYRLFRFDLGSEGRDRCEYIVDKISRTLMRNVEKKIGRSISLLAESDDRKYRLKYDSADSAVLNAGSFVKCRLIPELRKSIHNYESRSTLRVAPTVSLYTTHEAILLSVMSAFHTVDDGFDIITPEFQGTLIIDLRFDGKYFLNVDYHCPTCKYPHRLAANVPLALLDEMMDVLAEHAAAFGKAGVDAPELPRVPRVMLDDDGSKWSSYLDKDYCESLMVFAESHMCQL